jgi:hypothetical protein
VLVLSQFYEERYALDLIGTAVSAEAHLIASAHASAMRSPRFFHKLELDPAPTEHLRVLALLAYLRDPPSG